MANRLNEITILTYNRKAMESLRNEDYQSCLSLLTKAESLLSSNQFKHPSSLFGITLNNLACYYRRIGNPLLALNYLQKGLEILSKPPVDINQLGGTHLNISTILSQTGDHYNALLNVLKAINLIKSSPSIDNTLMTTLIAAYHNAGIEYEHLSHFLEALKIYTKAFELAKKHLSRNHPLYINSKNYILSIKDKNRHSSVQNRRTAAPSSRNSVTRSVKYSKNSEKLVTFNNLSNTRFVTGDRLQPMNNQKSTILNKKTNVFYRRNSQNSLKIRQKDQNTETEDLNKPELNLPQQMKTIKTNAAVVIQKH